MFTAITSLVSAGFAGAKAIVGAVQKKRAADAAAFAAKIAEKNAAAKDAYIKVLQSKQGAGATAQTSTAKKFLIPAAIGAAALFLLGEK